MHCDTLDYHARNMPTLFALKTSKKWWPGDLLSSTYIKMFICVQCKTTVTTVVGGGDFSTSMNTACE